MSLTAVKKEIQDHILDGMARTLWVLAYADWVTNFEGDDSKDRDDEGEEISEADVPEGPGPGGDWDEVAPETPDAAYLAARALTKLYRAAEGVSLPDLFELAMTVDQGEFQWETPDVRDELAHQDQPTQGDVAMEFGQELANMAVGSGASWFDNHKQTRLGARFDPTIPSFECTYDGDELTWEGFVDTSAEDAVTKGIFRHIGRGEQQAKYDDGEIQQGRLGSLTILSANASYARHRYVFQIGYYGHKFLVSADDEGDALDEIAEWVADNAPGLLDDEGYNNDYNDAIEHGLDSDAANEKASEDRIFVGAGAEPHYFASHEVAVLATDPDRDELYDLAGLGDTPNVNPAATFCDPNLPPASFQRCVKRQKRNPGNEGAAWGEGGEVAFETQEAVRAVVSDNQTLSLFEPEVFSTMSPEGKAYLASYQKQSRMSGSGNSAHAVHELAREEDEASVPFVFVRLHVSSQTSASDDEIRDIAKAGFETLLHTLDRQWPMAGHAWALRAWGWGFIQIQRGGPGHDQQAMFVIGLVRRHEQHRNPSSLTAKGDRMYEKIRGGYAAVGNQRAKEIAARTVLARAKGGARGLVQSPRHQQQRRKRTRT